MQLAENCTIWQILDVAIIAENIRHQQRKIIKYNHLVASTIILHNVVGMTLKNLAGLAPFRTAHINRYGDCTLDFRRKIRPFKFDNVFVG